MQQTFFIFIAILLLESVQIILFGIIKTFEMEQLWKIPAKSYYLVGLSSSIIFAFWFKWNLEGIWLGWLLGIITCILFEVRYLMKLDWGQKFSEVR